MNTMIRLLRNLSLAVLAGLTITSQVFAADPPPVLPDPDAALTVKDGAIHTGSGVNRGVGAVDLQMTRTAVDQVALGDFSVVAGGQKNRAIAVNSTVSGGHENFAVGDNSVIAGGFQNTARGLSVAIGGGFRNSHSETSVDSVIGGGRQNTNTAHYVVIGGGQNNRALKPNSTVAGGSENVANGSNSTISGGYQNTADGLSVAVGGGFQNVHSGTAVDAVIGGGHQNTNTSHYAVIGGGQFNRSDAYHAVVAGGKANVAAGPGSSIGGGESNSAAGAKSHVGGGMGNVSNGEHSSVVGGLNNSAAGICSTVVGGEGNFAGGSHSLAAGRRAKTNLRGAFVWADTSDADFYVRNGVPGFPADYADSFNVRAAGGFYFYTSPTTWLHQQRTGVFIGAGESAWSVHCDRHMKKDIAPVDYQGVLDKLDRVPVSSWRHQSAAENGTKNIGPMAQDFKREFFPGRDDKSISTLEFDGVQLAAIKGLREQNLQQARRIEKMEDELRDLRTLVKDLASLLRKDSVNQR